MKNMKRFKCSSVMLIDDEAIDNFVNEKLLRHYDFADKIYVHTSAKSALEYFKNIQRLADNGDSLMPDYIFLDINMPIIDGWGFLCEYEQTNLELNCKIVILTASVSPEDEEKAFLYKKVCAFFSKPLTNEQLKSLGV